MKAHTDFNDLATRSSLGREAVNRQVPAAVAQAVQAAKRKAKQKRERVEKQEQKQRRAVYLALFEAPQYTTSARFETKTRPTVS